MTRLTDAQNPEIAEARAAETAAGRPGGAAVVALVRTPIGLPDKSFVRVVDDRGDAAILRRARLSYDPGARTSTGRGHSHESRWA